jgi:hypothetical protein
VEPIFTVHLNIPPYRLTDLSVPQMIDHLEYLATTWEARDGE